MASWRPLPLAPSALVPPLLVSFSAGPSNYTIQITDLCSIWSETLERKSICIRAWNENTSIDPSDTPENMTTFLRSLASALEPSSSSSGLQLSPSSASNDGGLTLTVTCPLPGFPDLKWPFQLSSSPRASIASQLILPLVESQRLRAREHDALTSLLAQKDTVIAKLADKLESTGTGLDQVFTALAARKNITRASAEDKIKGLAPFDQSRWRAELNRNGDAAVESASDLLQAVFGTQSLLGEGAPTLDVADGWWTAFSATSSLAVRSKDDDATETKPAATPPPAAADDDDEFQVQLTPPRLRVNSSPQAPPLPTPAKAEPASPPKPKPAAKLGAIGGGAKKQEVSAPVPPPPPAGADEDTASETASEADPDETASVDVTMRSPTPPLPAKTASPPRKKIGGLGRIGGGAKAAAAPAPEPEAPQESPPKPQASRKLGQIGGGGGGSEDARGRSATKEQEAPPPVRETSEERADKKREELKRNLEKQAAAGPTKKKRRF